MSKILGHKQLFAIAVFAKTDKFCFGAWCSKYIGKPLSQHLADVIVSENEYAGVIVPWLVR